MPIKLKQLVEPIPEPAPEAPAGWRQGLAGLLRVAGGAGSFLGPVVGAATGAASEAGAELIEGSPLSTPRILAEAALGAVPGRFFFRAGKPVASAIRSGAMAGGGDIARQFARGENIDLNSTALATMLGAGTGGLIGKYASKGDVTPPPPGETFEVVPTAQRGGQVLSPTGKGTVAAGGSRTITGASPDASYRMPGTTVEPVVTEAGIPYQTGIDPFGSAAKSAARETKEEAKELARIAKEQAQQQRLITIREAREGAGATGKKTSFGASVSAPTPEGGTETMRTSFKAPKPKKSGGSQIISDMEAAAAQGDEQSFAALQKILGKGKDLPEVGTPAREIFEAWVAKGRDPKIALKLAAKGTRPLEKAAEPVAQVAETVIPTTVPTATYLGEQEGVGPLFNIVGGPSSGSTVATETLQRMGIPVPEVPTAAPSILAAASDEPFETLYPVGKVLTPAQEAQERGYRELQERLRAEGRPTPTPQVEVPPTVVQEAPSPVVAPVAEASVPSPVAQPAGPLAELLTPAELGTVPLFKSRVDAAGQHYRGLKDLLASGAVEKGTKKAPSPAQIGRGIAGKSLSEEAQAVGLPTQQSARQVAPLPEPVSTQVPPVSADPTQRARAEELLRMSGWADDEIAQYFADAATRGEGGGTVLGAGFGGFQDLANVIRRNPEFATRLGLGAAGAAAGAIADPFDNPLISAVAGGAVGAGLPAVVTGLRGLGLPEELASELQTPEGVKSVAGKVFQSVPIMMRFNYLADLVGLPANMWVGPYGSATFGALEHALSGDPRGWAALKMLTPKNFMVEFGKGREEAIRLLREGELGRAEQTLLGPHNLGKIAEVVDQPGILMTSGDVASRNILKAAGFTDDEARRITLTSEPVRTGFKRVANFSKGSPFLQMLQPFSRTPANIGEQGLERLPGIGALAQFFLNRGDELPQVMAQQAIGSVLAGGGYLAGSQLDPETAKIARRYITNLGGQYSLPVAAGFAAGQSVQRGQPVVSGATVGALNQALPLPSMEPVVDAAKFFLTEDPQEIPRWAAPPQVTSMLEEFLGMGPSPLSGPPSLPARYTKTARP